MTSVEGKQMKHLRRLLLETLCDSRMGPMGGLYASTLLDIVAPLEEGMDERTGMAAIRDLVLGGYATTEDKRTLKSDVLRPSKTWVAITAKGVALAEGNGPVDPQIEDERR